MIAMRIIVAVDSFKGTLSSSGISKIIKETYEPRGHEVTTFPISDGGEGFVTAIKSFYQKDAITIPTIGPLGDPIYASYVIHDACAFIELSSVVGLTTIHKNRLNPLRTSTFGLGLLVRDAITKGATTIVLGLGGSATNDAGAGMLQALGVEFYAHGKSISEPINGNIIANITSFDTKAMDHLIKGVTFDLANDVKNPLLGTDGCANIYAEQKGADKNMRDLLEQHMTSYANIVEAHFKDTFRFRFGAGAAGGFGFGAMAFLNARIMSGIDYMINLLDIESTIRETDLVIVGEGRLDQQTLFGKAPYGIAKLAKRHNKKVIGIFGISDYETDTTFMDEIHVVVPKYADIETSMNHPAAALKTMLEHIKV
jgi:glycerate 2-kinase